MNILGISAFYHDSAAALIVDGVVKSAAQEERFSRVKHDSRFPKCAIEYCLQENNLNFTDIDKIFFYEKPLLKFKRIMSTYVQYSPVGFTSFRRAMSVWFGNKLYQKRHILSYFKSQDSSIDWSKKILFSDHHLSHAASAFFPSPFEEAAVITLDGVGEWVTTSIMYGLKNKLKPLKEIRFPHSLGLLYSAFTYFTGFSVNSGEYKLMGLAPYGYPQYVNMIKQHLIDIKEDGSYRLNLKYFNYCTGLTMTNQLFENIFKVKRRVSEAPIEQFHMDIAASIQAVTEEILLKTIKYARQITGCKNLCLAGGVALNCVANGKIEKSKIFENIWIQPASGDAGGALGAAYVGYYMYANRPRDIQKVDSMRGGYLGPSFTSEQVQVALNRLGAVYSYFDDEVFYNKVTELLESGNSMGWFQGKMEYGPRALGGRSIIADPRSQDMQKTLNLKIKFRESFRPFAPAILFEHLSDWFDLESSSPYMLKVANVLKKHQLPVSDVDSKKSGLDLLKVSRSAIPAVTHVNYSARIQTVHKETNPRFHRLLDNFYKKTGCPILVNTSFNVRGEPIVCTPEDAFKCFMGTGLDALVIDNFILIKGEQNKELCVSYYNKFKLD